MRRDVGQATTVALTTEFVTSVMVEWRVVGGETNTAGVTAADNGRWTFDLPASLQPVTVEWRAHLQGEGPEQTTPWFQLQSDEPSWTVDETAAYLQSITMLVVFMAAFLAVQRQDAGSSKDVPLLDEEEVV